MQIGNRLRVLAVLFALGVGASPATAQITTATVSGTVKDSTGGVVPGATVVLINEARGTKSVPAITNATGDYVFPNVAPGTYTVEVTMDRVPHRSADQCGHQRRRPPRCSRAHARTRWRGRDGQRHRRSAAASRRRAANGRSPSRRVGREPADRQPQLRQPLRQLDARRHRHATRLGGGGEQHHDGRRLDDGHRQQRPDAADERRGDRRGQGADLRLPGRVRPVERPADHGRHQERHQPVPRLALRRRARTRTGTRTAGRTS